MSINKGKHIIKEVEEVRCTIVEKGVSEERMKFLKELLEHNGFEVKVGEEEIKKPPAPPPVQDEEGGTEVEVPTEAEEDIPPTFVIGVTDLVFNPVIAVYQRLLRTKDGFRVTPDFWNQKTDKTEPNYWDLSKK